VALMASRIVQNSLLSAISGASTLLGGFVSTIIVARWLGVAATGGIAYVTWISAMGVTLLDLGAQASLARYLPEVRRGGTAAADAFAAALFRPYLAICCALIAVVGAGAALWGGPLLAGVGRIEGVAAVGGLCLLQTLANFALGELRGQQNFRAAALTTLVSMILQIVFVVGGAVAFGEIGVVLGYGCGSLPLALRALRILGRRRETQVPGLERRHVRFALYSWAGGVASALVWSRSEVFFLQRSWGEHAVALLTAGFTFANLAAQGPLLLTGALLPFFSEKVGVDREGVNRAFASGTRILAFMALPLCFGAAGVMPGLIAITFGPHFADASLPASIIVIATALAAPGAVGTHVMYARDRSDFIFYATSVGAVLSVLAGLLIVPRYGLMGAACSRAVIQVLLVVAGFAFLGGVLKCPAPINHLLRLIVSAAVCGLAARATLDALSGGMALPLAVGVGAVVYFLCVRLLGALPEEDLARLRDLQSRLPKAFRWAPAGLANILSRRAPPSLLPGLGGGPA
jgi:O-antigen/teichoic acid export membrane protein